MPILIGPKGVDTSFGTFVPYQYIDWLSPSQESQLVQGGDASYADLREPNRAQRTQILRTYNLLGLGCKIDKRVVFGVTVTAGSDVIQVSDALFKTGQDEGKSFRAIENAVSAAPTKAIRGFIVSVLSNTSIRLDTTATSSFTGSGEYGSDDTAPFLQAAAKAAQTGGLLLVPCGIPDGDMTGQLVLRPTGTIVIDDGVILQGEGNDYGRVQDPLKYGSGISLHSFLAGGATFIQLGNGGGASVTTGNTAAQVRNISIDGQRLCGATVAGNSRRTRVEYCTIWRGANNAVRCGPDAWIERSNIGNQNEGTPLLVLGDCHVINNIIRQGGLNGSNVLFQALDGEFIGNHLFSGGGGDALTASIACPNIIIGNPSSTEDGGLLNIVGNQLDSVYGPQIRLAISGTRTIQCLNINNNVPFSAASVPANTFPFLDLAHGAGTKVMALNVNGNNGNGGVTNGTTWSALVAKTDAGTVEGFTCEQNKGLNCQKMFIGIRPDSGLRGNVIWRGTGTGGTKYLSDNAGTFTGNGGGTTFVVAHGLDDTPTVVHMTPATAAARGDYHWTADATNITFTYASATPSGANNVSFSWSATL